MCFLFCWKEPFLAANIHVHVSKHMGMTPQKRFDLQRRKQEASFGLLDSFMLSSEDSSADPMGDH